ETVSTALELGYRHVDTAQAYGNERAVGAGIRAADVDREEVFLATKLAGGNRRHDAVVESTRRSLARLDTGYVDLLLIHWPHPVVPDRETLSAMARLREEGLVRHVGVSNFSLSRLDRVREESPAPVFTDQVQYHSYRDRDSLVDYCAIHDLALTAYSPLARGAVADDDLLVRIGRRYGKSPAQVALRWFVQQPGVVAIPKASTRAHLRENIDVFDFELTDDEMRAVWRPGERGGLSAFVRSQLGL
ncbi:aldehyde oxidoreductase, partial [Halobacteriales archaeon QS_1_68_17]